MSYSGSKRKRPSRSTYVTRKRTRVAPARSMGLAPARTGGYFGVSRRRARNEYKTVDVDPANYNVTSTGSVTLLNGVATGTDFTDRIGRRIMMKKHYFRGVVFPEDNNTGQQLVRMIIVYDMQSNGAAPGVTDVLKSADATSQLNLNNRDRFRILTDKQWVLAPIDNTATQSFAGSPTIHQFKKFKKLNHEVQYNGTTNSIGSIATGAMFMLLIGSNAAGTAATIRVSHRIRFVDA